MISKRSPRQMIVVSVTIIAMVGTASTIFAKDASRSSAKSALPGVNRDYRIVRPIPEPDNRPTANEDGWFKIGDTKVRISGGITVDVGGGSIPVPRH